jgi:Zn-finger nucleic acid-binding protein
MLTYERNGIHVDQCRECRGVFLDRGELERLIDLEADAMGLPGRAPAPAGGRPDREGWTAGGAYDPRYDAREPRYDAGYDRDRPRDWDDDDDDRPFAGRGRRGGFLEDIFGGFGD